MYPGEHIYATIPPGLLHQHWYPHSGRATFGFLDFRAIVVCFVYIIEFLLAIHIISQEIGKGKNTLADLAQRSRQSSVLYWRGIVCVHSLFRMPIVSGIAGGGRQTVHFMLENVNATFRITSRQVVDFKGSWTRILEWWYELKFPNYVDRLGRARDIKSGYDQQAA